MIPEFSAIFLRVFAAFCYALVFGSTFRSAWRDEHGREYSDFERVWGVDLKTKDRCTNVTSLTLIFPMGLALIFAGFVWRYGWQAAPAQFFRFSSDLLLTMSVYYLALFALMPALRQRVSARACATAWLLPTILFYAIVIADEAPMPRLVICCPAELLDMLVPVWLVGFLLVFGWFVVSHLRFRRRVLKASSDETDEAVLDVWRQELAALELKTRIRLVRCTTAATPFSMPGTRKNPLTVLPACPYTEEELRLIFRHELHHIQRSDFDAKFFFAFLCALFWFHPLVWMAARESAKDMELSCDEIVLDQASDAERKRYADLLLHTAGETRGFTTCLSADAASLRYRLRNVMQKRPRRPGTGLLAAFLFVCFLFHGTLAFADERCTVGELLVDADGMDHFLYEVYDRETGYYDSINEAEAKDKAAEALRDYLLSLSAERLIGSVDHKYSEDRSPRLYLSDSSGSVQGVRFYDHGITVDNWYQPRGEGRIMVYYVRENIDWEKIEAIIFE